MIWCIEDDDSIRDIEIYALQSTGFEARGFANADAFWTALTTEKPTLIILDVMMPGEDGVSLLTRLKQLPDFCHIPVIMATAKGAEYDKIKGLDLGADDYLVKPFGMMEMVSRVKAVLRRCHPSPAAAVCKNGGLILNQEEHTVSIDGVRVLLRYKEYELLRLFLTHPGVAFSRDQLFIQIWGTDYIGDSRTLDVHIRTLRQKLGVHGQQIETVRGVGYRWEADYGR